MLKKNNLCLTLWVHDAVVSLSDRCSRNSSQLCIQHLQSLQWLSWFKQIKTIDIVDINIHDNIHTLAAIAAGQPYKVRNYDVMCNICNSLK